MLRTVQRPVRLDWGLRGMSRGSGAFSPSPTPPFIPHDRYPPRIRATQPELLRHDVPRCIDSISFRSSAFSLHEDPTRVAGGTVQHAKNGALSITMYYRSIAATGQKKRRSQVAAGDDGDQMLPHPPQRVEYFAEPHVRCSLVATKKRAGSKAVYRNILRRRVREAIVKMYEQSLRLDPTESQLWPKAPLDMVVSVTSAAGALTTQDLHGVVRQVYVSALQRLKIPKVPCGGLIPGSRSISHKFERLCLDEEARPQRKYLYPLQEAVRASPVLDTRLQARIRSNVRAIEADVEAEQVRSLVNAAYASSGLTCDTVPYQVIRGLLTEASLERKGRRK